ncbi:hypothetical protein BDU57DRAFT_488312 [Ampelomyces quisqualis]|uniref:RING-type domain-containing protein n=1 Tax=Ampelomyces quisqualis TaxID=50730 RepID=A0A6A5R217_AMPQU|nr:hypothetical protein BDU57DRAFT_488312 [Ampelomyces quisqualis]
MLLSRLQRLPWQLTCLLFATVATASISPSNASTAIAQFHGTLPLQEGVGTLAHVADLVPITNAAATQTIEGNLRNINFSNVANVVAGDIAYISCNPVDYSGLVGAQRVFEEAYKAANISGVVLYSTATDYCDYEPSNDVMQDFPVLSMTNQQASASIRDNIHDLSGNNVYAVRVRARGDDNSSSGGLSNPNPLGPSPSTAVAMIILYSITGIITALFLVIIVTGAIRAHRHPERYGPRNVLGRPRQSRARGLGRAILDTIPIVKFGEKEPAKPADVELASSAETRNVNGIDASQNQTNPTTNETGKGPDSAETNEMTNPSTIAPPEEQQEGIAPAQSAVAAAATTGKDTSTPDENLGCSICTEDFENGQDLRVLPCDHKFHPECVDPWLLNVSGTCPLCRVDLRPITSRDSALSDDNPDAAPSSTDLDQTTSLPHRSAFRDILSLRHRPNATPQERIYYLRRLREQRRLNRSGDVAEHAVPQNTEESTAADWRRSTRMSARLSGVFGGGRRRERSPQQVGESSTAGAQPAPPSDEAPVREQPSVTRT